MNTKLKAYIPKEKCVACGSCMEACPTESISIFHGSYAIVNTKNCVGCKKCYKVCPISIIEFKEEKNEN
ncbi:MAG: 4Fe-4S binding protein [Fusobacterium sp. JB021]|nr:4Fe-4S binding protein [Fusobacterium sp. JB021]MDP0506779.1 4Fe-4S binding protein [Fusobacterium sp. JB019]